MVVSFRNGQTIADHFKIFLATIYHHHLKKDEAHRHEMAHLI
jgi:hypothetical protein